MTLAPFSHDLFCLGRALKHRVLSHCSKVSNNSVSEEPIKKYNSNSTHWVLNLSGTVYTKQGPVWVCTVSMNASSVHSHVNVRVLQGSSSKVGRLLPVRSRITSYQISHSWNTGLESQSFFWKCKPLPGLSVNHITLSKYEWHGEQSVCCHGLKIWLIRLFVQLWYFICHFNICAMFEISKHWLVFSCASFFPSFEYLS